jgi:voltage-gated potassium channel
MAFPRNRSKERLHEIIFEADTPAGKRFDVILLIMILLSVFAVMLESVQSLGTGFKKTFYVLEWIFTIFFTLEYIFRLYSVYKPIKYATSFFGIIDLASILPTYLSIFFPGSQSLIVIRALRLMRVFRIFKMINFLNHGKVISDALKNSRPKIIIFMSFVVVIVCIFGSLMYFIEGGYNEQFDSIPRAMYWAIVTMTTVGYGDISPTTNLGQFIAAIIMLLGYAVIAVPTGIVSSELSKSDADMSKKNLQTCRFCSKEGHDNDAVHCKFCGEILNEESFPEDM